MYNGDKAKQQSRSAMMARFKQHPISMVAVVAAFLGLVLLGWRAEITTLSMGGLRGGGGNSYVVIIDAGSSGSRAHVFRHRDGVVVPEHESLKVKPGLSSFASDPSQAGPSLGEAIDFAKKHVPASEVGRTPLILKATAGMRLLPDGEKNEVMDNVRTYLSGTGFLFSEENAHIIDGEEEGLLGWMSVNYLNQSPGSWGVMELGGASIQVTTKIDSSDDAVPKEHSRTYQLPNDSSPGVVYTHSFLGLGMESARKAVSDLLKSTGGAEDPCLQKGYHRPAEGGDSDLFTGVEGTTPSGSYDGCASLIKKALFMPSGQECQHPRGCLFNGLFAPSLEGKLWAFENFYYTPSALAVPGVPGETEIRNFETAARENCGMGWAEMDAGYPKDWQPKEINNKWCFGMTYIYLLLTEGLQLKPEQKITVSNEVGNNGIDWALGAAIHSLA